MRRKGQTRNPVKNSVIGLRGGKGMRRQEKDSKVINLIDEGRGKAESFKKRYFRFTKPSLAVIGKRLDRFTNTLKKRGIHQF